jgi:hypothetical protein
MKILSLVFLAFAVAGCASMDGTGLRAGASASQVEAVMGQPADKRVRSNGETWLYYPRQPYGYTNYVARLGSDNRLIALEQRLTDENVALIERNKTRAEDVRELLGPPYRVWPFPRMQRDILDYRMMSVRAPGTPQGLYVQVSPDGVVREVFMENDPDNRLSEGGGGANP